MDFNLKVDKPACAILAHFSYAKDVFQGDIIFRIWVIKQLQERLEQ